MKLTVDEAPVLRDLRIRDGLLELGIEHVPYMLQIALGLYLDLAQLVGQLAEHLLVIVILLVLYHGHPHDEQLHLLQGIDPARANIKDIFSKGIKG